MRVITDSFLFSVALCIASGCSLRNDEPSTPPPREPSITVLGEFEADLDPGRGTFLLRGAGDVATTQQGLTEVPVGVTGNPGTGVSETVKLLTTATPTTSAATCGGSNRYCGDVRVVSYFTTQTLSNVHVEIVDIQPPTARNSYNGVAFAGLSSTLGLWGYGSLAPGSGATRTWGFNIPDGTNFTIRGRVMADLCPAGQVNCGGSCVNTQTSAAHCGACDTPCGSTSTTTYACAAGACGMTGCQAGRANCDNAPGNGCEVDLGTNNTHCGACNAPCSSTSTTTYACSASTCTMTGCVAGRGNCDGLASNGCEINLLDDSQNCGSCGASAAVQTCTGGSLCGSYPCNVYPDCSLCGSYSCGFLCTACNSCPHATCPYNCPAICQGGAPTCF